MTSEIFLFVRPGFEQDLAEELHALGAVVAEGSDAGELVSGPGFLRLAYSSRAMAQCVEAVVLEKLIFARQCYAGVGTFEFESSDRVSQIVLIVKDRILGFASCNAFSGFDIETPDEDEAKELSGFAKSLSRPLENRLNKEKLLPKGPGARKLPRLKIVLLSDRSFWIGVAVSGWSSPHSCGIVRLRFPSDAPSRSTLKLEEAFHVFLGAEKMEKCLIAGMSAVDLGACPGGWTYQFVKRGISVVAVDNGKIDQQLMASGLVVHLMEDCFRFRPTKPVDWLVCDVVEKPAMITDLMCLWAEMNWCKYMVFNLKLPMAKRFLEVAKCLDVFSGGLKKKGISAKVLCKQLYHDRKEVTVYVELV